MKPEEAEQIVQDYGGAVASLKKDQAVLPLTALPYSKIRIRYAFYMYIEELVKMDALEQDHANALVHTYALLNSRFQENADRINILHEHYTTSEKARKELAEYGGITTGMPVIEEMDELANYIEECRKVKFD